MTYRLEQSRTASQSQWLPVTNSELDRQLYVMCFVDVEILGMIIKKLTLTAVGLAAMALPVRADVIVRQVPEFFYQQAPFVRRTTTVMMPMQITTERTTTEMVVPFQQQTITSSAVVTESTLGSVSNFQHRLDMLRDQISGAEQQGLLNTAAAADLMSRYQTLAVDLSDNPVMTRDRYDAFEQQINLLNQDVSNSMSR
jgi:hypothetical protein